MTELAVTIGRELRRLRLREGMTQQEVADALAIPRAVVCRRERGRHVMHLSSVAAHARAVGGGLGHVLVQVDLASGALTRRSLP